MRKNDFLIFLFLIIYSGNKLNAQLNPILKTDTLRIENAAVFVCEWSLSRGIDRANEGYQVFSDTLYKCKIILISIDKNYQGSFKFTKIPHIKNKKKGAQTYYLMENYREWLGNSVTGFLSKKICKVAVTRCKKTLPAVEFPK